MPIKKILRMAGSLIFVLAAIYCGISSVATFLHAAAQPHIMAAGTRVDFLGYTIMAYAWGALCLIGVGAAILIWVLMKPTSPTEEKEPIRKTR